MHSCCCCIARNIHILFLVSSLRAPLLYSFLRLHFRLSSHLIGSLVLLLSISSTSTLDTGVPCENARGRCSRSGLIFLCSCRTDPIDARA